VKISLLNTFCLFTIIALVVSLYTVKKRKIILHSAATNFNVEIRDALIEDSPEWANTDVSPPMNLCEVMKVSVEVRSSLDRISKTSGRNRWECLGVTLCPLDASWFSDSERSNPKKWCYLLRFCRYSHEVVDKLTINETYEILDAFVLMNGDIVINEGGNTEVEETLKRDLEFSSQVRFSNDLRPVENSADASDIFELVP